MDIKEESVVIVSAGGGATSEGKPGWLVLSPTWSSQEARTVEAAIIVMKQALDLQAVQVSGPGGLFFQCICDALILLCPCTGVLVADSSRLH